MLYIGNTFFEWELEGRIAGSLSEALKCSPVCRQLQYLPLIYLDQEDTLMVTDLPTSNDLEHLQSYGIKKLPKMRLLENPPKGKVHAWGASNIVYDWAKRHDLPYAIPALDVVRRLNSKLWNFERVPKLCGAVTVSSERDIKQALVGSKEVWVLKTDQGFAGTGHCIFHAHELDKAFKFQRKIGTDLLLEPWVERVLDFSSQWEIAPNGELIFLGVTKFFNTSSGQYLGTEVGEISSLFSSFENFINEHIVFCKNYLQNIINEGYFGCLGVDAMIYKCAKTGINVLHPVVEVNARMTMSSALLRFCKKYMPNKIVDFTFKEMPIGTLGLLPTGFRRQLIPLIK